jgi:4-hydroxybenzoate polyprenyltransferase
VISVTEAWVLAMTGAAVYAVAAWAIAPICLALAPFPLAVFIGYPYLKRFTPWCHLGVGLGLAMAPLGGWFAARLSFADVGPPLLLAGFTLGWVAGFDIIYATLDQVHDRAVEIRSLPARYGRRGALAISRGIHGIAWSLLAALVAWRLNVIAALPFLLIVGALLVWEQRKAHDVDLAFFRINVWVGFAALAVVVMGLTGA